MVIEVIKENGNKSFKKGNLYSKGTFAIRLSGLLLLEKNQTKLGKQLYVSGWFRTKRKLFVAKSIGKV